MSLVEELHQAHKARLARMNALPFKAKIVRPEPKPEPVCVEEKPKPQFWFWPIIEPSERHLSEIDRIQRVICKFYDIRRLDLISQRKTADLSLPRQIGMYLSRERTTASYPKISRKFGRSDHSTSLYAARKIEGLLLVDCNVAFDVAHIELALDQMVSG